MKILHLVSTFEPGGIERWLLGILPHLDLHKYQMDFYCRIPKKGVLVDDVIANGGFVYHHSGHRFNFLNYSRELKCLLLMNDYDMIHNHLAHHGAVASYIAKKHKIPTIVSFHNSRLSPLQFGSLFRRYLSRLYTKESLKYMVRNASLITCCSDDVMLSIDAIVPFRHLNASVLHYGVNLSRDIHEEKIREIKASINIELAKKIVIHVGSFTHQKNHQGIVEIASAVLKNRGDVVFVLVGDGDLRPLVEENVQAIGLHNSFRFLGIRNDIETILAAADIFLFPSLFEGLPVACLEALAAGLPVIGSNVDGIKLLVQDGYTGYLCQGYDINQFAERIDLLLDNQMLRKEIGGNGANFIRDKFSYEASARKLSEFYDQIQVMTT